MILGIIVVVAGGIGAAALYNTSTSFVPVVAMSADVTRGQEVARDQLTVVEVPRSLAADGVPPEGMEDLVGKRALVDLPAGSYPHSTHVGDDPLPDGLALVGLRLPLGKVPASELVPGTAVVVVSLVEGDAATVDATVAAAPIELDDGTSYALDVRVAEPEAAQVARWAATDQAAIVVTEVS